MKFPTSLFSIIAVTVAVALVSCEPSATTQTANATNANPWDDLPELEINRPPQPAPAPVEPSTFELDENGMATITIGHIQPGAFIAEAAIGKPIDYRQIGRAILERAGIEFPQGADAYFDPVTGLFEVRNTPQQLELVDAYFAVLGSGREHEIACRFEIFEMPAAAAELLAESADAMPRHDDLRSKVIAACHSGDARFLTSIDLPARSGQRAKSETISRSLYPSPKSKAEAPEHDANEAAQTTPPALLDWRQSGLEVEVDPVLGADGITIDMNIAFSQVIRRAGESENTNSEPPSLLLQTEITLVDQTTHLIGIYPARETHSELDPETGNRQRLVFVQASVRRF